MNTESDTNHEHAYRNWLMAPAVASFAILCSIMSLSRGHWPENLSYWWIGLSVSWLFLLGQQSKPFWKAAGAALLLSASTFLFALWLDQTVGKQLEANSGGTEWIARPSSALLNLLGYTTTASDGLLHVDHSEGVVSILASPEKTGLRWMANFLFMNFLLIAFGGRSMSIRGTALIVVGVYGFICIRFVVCMLLYFETGSILSNRGGGPWLFLLSGFWSYVISIGLLAVLMDWVIRKRVRLHRIDSSTEVETGESKVQSVLVNAVIFGSLLLATILCWKSHPSGPEKQGRVLIDDRLCGQWEPTARMLDTQWYGDYSTYSFSSLVEWLGHYYSVDVNTSRRYSRELLNNYDVLVLKTPERPLSSDEQQAILEWTKDGGGLLLVGDHTNLLGMGSHLNALAIPAGIRFKYDAVVPRFSGGFNSFQRNWMQFDPVVNDVEKLEFMTSCSLEIKSGVRPVMVVDDCIVEPHDYANSSFFGTNRSYPETRYGPAVLSAIGDYGHGRVAAFTDSTVWSSFAIFMHNRHKLLLGLVDQLNHGSSSLKTTLAILGYLLIIVSVPFANRIFLDCKIVLVVLLGVVPWLATLSINQVHQKTQEPPSAFRQPKSAVFLWEGGRCAFPATLGSIGKLDLSDAYDTCFVATQRLGIQPRVAWSYEQVFQESADVVILIRPMWSPPSEFAAQLKDFVSNGGSLVILDELETQDAGSAQEIAQIFDIPLICHGRGTDHGKNAPHVHHGDTTLYRKPEGPMQVLHLNYGEGNFVYLMEATRFSRAGMGHCFAVPWKEADYSYQALYTVLTQVTDCAPKERRFYGILK